MLQLPSFLLQALPQVLVLFALILPEGSVPVTEPLASSPTSESAYYVAKNGDDSNSGTSLSAPFQTIQKCASLMIQGNTCYVRAGIYRETITPANSGTPSAPIAFQP